jgi:signal transduction histidine kinase
MFFAAILNFFFFLVARERVYLYFSIYLLISGINRMNVEFYYAFFREFRTLSVYIINFAHVFTFASLTIFIQSLLHTKVYLPRWDKFLTIFIIYSTVIGIAALLGLISWQPNSPFYARHVIIFSYVANVEIILLTFLLLLKIKKIERPVARLILPVQIIWGIGWPAYVLYLFFGYPLIGKVLSPLWANQWWYVIETVGLSWLAISFSWILLQRFRGMQKQIVQQALDREKEKNQLIAEQKIELERTVDERTSELKHSLTELQSTQSQLIQREKMASLGELTAGIAHEIQNPLNFVNNFSDVNREMITELEQELRTGNVEEALAIAADLKGNEEKISHHGKRADFIVKGMLQHSRSSGGEKQSTNMNVLCDEFLKLSYHGMRAKDKSFNAETVTNFGTGLPRINVSQQDIGRVMLNLINNAFYAVNEKATTSGPDYKPIVELSTAQSDGHIEIRVKDNGNGIPENIKDKIFQPFFTTKPTGEGTGLGLSLSYDIVVKEHGGKIDVESKQGEGSEFTVMLPAIS